MKIQTLIYYGVARSFGVTSNDTEMMINHWTGRGILVFSDKLILKWFCSFSSAQKTPQTFKWYAETKCFLRVMLWCNGHSLSKPSRKRQLKCLAQKLPSLSWSQPALWRTQQCALTNCRYPSSQQVSTYSHCVKSVTWGKCSYNLKNHLPSGPLVIKDGNIKSSMYGSFPLKPLYIGDFTIAIFDFRRV